MIIYTSAELREMNSAAILVKQYKDTDPTANLIVKMMEEINLLKRKESENINKLLRAVKKAIED